MLRDSGLMEDRDYRTYMSLFSNMSNFMRRPNLIIYLEVGPEESLARIKSRARDMESTISLEYLTNLFNAYEHFIKDISRVIPVIKVNWRTFRTAEVRDRKRGRGGEEEGTRRRGLGGEGLVERDDFRFSSFLKYNSKY